MVVEKTVTATILAREAPLVPECILRPSVSDREPCPAAKREDCSGPAPMFACGNLGQTNGRKSKKCYQKRLQKG